MADYSQFNGTLPASPVSSGTWSIQRKWKPTDPDPEKRKRDQGGKDEKRDKDTLSLSEPGETATVTESEEQDDDAVLSHSKERDSRKIDLII